jgi:hypothetical protein
MQPVPTKPRDPGDRDQRSTVTQAFSTGDLGWRDLPPDGRLKLTVRFTVTRLVDVHGSYQGRAVAFEVRDAVRGSVTLTDQSAQTLDAAAVRAFRVALDEMGVRLARE